MAELFAILNRHSDLLFLLAFAWMMVSMAIAVRRRKSKGLPVTDAFPEGAIFLEKWTSGRSLSSPFARWGGAHNCLFVAVTKDRLIVRPHFPFVLFMPASSGLELSIPRQDIERVILPMGGRVLVDFRRETGPVRIELRLREPAKFRNSLHQG